MFVIVFTVAIAGLLIVKFSLFVKLLSFEGSSIQHMAFVRLLGRLVNSLVWRGKKKSDQIVKALSTGLDAKESARICLF